MMILGFVLGWMLRSSLLIAVGALLLAVLRVKDASIRLAASVTMLCASLVVPVLTATVPSLPLLASKPAQVAVMPMVNAPPSVIVPPTVVPESVPRLLDWKTDAIAAYLLVAALLVVRLAVGLMLSLRLLRRSRPTGRSANGVEVRESDTISVPVTLGIFRAAIVLPANWREWDEVKLQAVLAHERSHVRRKDPLVQGISALHRALLWLTPLSWYLHHQIVRVAEEASDDAALAAVRDRESYAGVLLDFMGHARRVAWQGVAMARGRKAEQRVRRILDGNTLSRGLTLGSAVAIVVLASPLAYVAAAARPYAAPAAPVVVPVAKSMPAMKADATPLPVTATPATEDVASAQTTPSTPSPSATAATPSTAETAPTSSGAIRHYVIVHGNSMSGSWDSDEEDVNALRSQFGQSFAWFRQNRHEYVVTDADVLAQLDKALEPQKNVNRMQSDVNMAQSRVNGMQAKVNSRQNDVNSLQKQVNRRQDLVNQIQAAVSHGDNPTLLNKLQAEMADLQGGIPDANQDKVNRKQVEVNQEQAGVNQEQSKVNAMQQKVSQEQNRVSAEFSGRVQEILGSAVSKGLAKELK